MLTTALLLLQLLEKERNYTAIMQSTGTESNKFRVKRYQTAQKKEDSKNEPSLERIISLLLWQYKSKDIKGQVGPKNK